MTPKGWFFTQLHPQYLFNFHEGFNVYCQRYFKRISECLNVSISLLQICFTFDRWSLLFFSKNLFILGNHTNVVSEWKENALASCSKLNQYPIDIRWNVVFVGYYGIFFFVFYFLIQLESLTFDTSPFPSAKKMFSISFFPLSRIFKFLCAPIFAKKNSEPFMENRKPRRKFYWFSNI